jgi:ATP phosphoribosyltransferase
MAPTTPDGTERLLRVAVPNKGALSQAASEILGESGYRQRRDSKELSLIDAENGVEFFYLRPRDIALYVGEGTLDTGITGRDLLRDSGAQADEALTLGFGRSRFHFAGPAGRYTDLAQLAGLRIAPSYVGVVEAAAESWMAADHEGKGRAAEEISQLLYHAQVLMLATGLTLDDVSAHP